MMISSFCLVYFLFFLLQLKVGRFLDVPSSSHRRCSRNCFERFCCARNLNDFFYRKTAYAELLLPVFVVLVRLVKQQHRQRQRWRFVLVFSSGVQLLLGLFEMLLASAGGRNKTKQKQKEKHTIMKRGERTTRIPSLTSRCSPLQIVVQIRQ